MKRMKMTPNFFVSTPYCDLNSVQVYTQNNWIWVEEGEWILFPPLPLNGFPEELPPGNVWSDFGFDPWEGYQREFLDFQYFYIPQHFNDLSGGLWQVYRKNSRKWQRSNEKWEYTDSLKKPDDPLELIANWLEGKQDTVQDGEFLIDFAHLSDHPEIERRYLYSGDQLRGINAWDENYQFINYRVCITVDEPFIQEFIRLLFYTDPFIQQKHKWVNDGGVLDNPGLKSFKDKMNPNQVTNIYSWIKNNKNGNQQRSTT